jgi:hypothetical protein
MGGGRQLASKVAHAAFVENPEIRDFLANCAYMREPDEREREAIRARFVAAPASNQPPPDLVIAIDGSPYESSFHEGLPSTRAGYFKVSGVAVSVAKYRAASDEHRRFLDPFAMAAIYEGRDALTFCLPSSNMEYRGAQSVKHGFRMKLFEEFTADKTRILRGSGDTFLDTLFRLAELTPVRQAGDDEEGGRPKGVVIAGVRHIRVHKCPWCQGRPPEGFLIPQTACQLVCRDVLGEAGCDGLIYATDALRVHESVTTQGANLQAITRTMNVVEAVFLAHLILHLVDSSPQALSRACFVIDGPLAMFGEAAWMHGGLLRLYHAAHERLAALGLPGFLLFGIQKGGQVAEHAAMLRPHLAAGESGRDEIVMAVADDYRNEFIRERDDAGKNFGDETYWGQDFLYRAANGDIFVIGLPYPTPSKRVPDPAGIMSAEEHFRDLKVDLGRYPDLGRVLDVVRLMRSDLYENSIVPVLAAHQDASISLMPGGRVLDILSLESFATARRGGLRR